VGGEMLPLSRAEVVQDGDIIDIIFFKQPVHQVAADKSGTTGDQYRSHFAHLFLKGDCYDKRFPFRERYGFIFHDFL